MVGYFVVNIRNIRKGRANKRDWDHRPMATATGAVDAPAENGQPDLELAEA